MALQGQGNLDTTLGIKYNLSTPKKMMEKAHANLYSVTPNIDTTSYHNSLGVIETGNVSMDLPKATPVSARKKKKHSSKIKRKKSKNTRKTKS